MEILTGALAFFWIILLILAILLPIFVYTAQKWAYKCYKELIIVNKTLSKMDDKLQLLKMKS